MKDVKEMVRSDSGVCNASPASMFPSAAPAVSPLANSAAGASELIVQVFCMRAELLVEADLVKTRSLARQSESAQKTLKQMFP